MTPTYEFLCFEEDDRTWLFDTTFLLSSWSCIFGAGCQGLMTGDASHLQQGCCSYGAHFISDDDVENVQRHMERLEPRHWQFHDEAKEHGWLAPAGERGENRSTRMADDACIFLNRPGFEGGIGCALHNAAVEAGERPMDWKPTVCWQVPLRLSQSEDSRGHVTVTLREWKRRDWGEGGSEFHWWCTDSHEAFVGKDPVYVYLRDEITELIGETMYAKLAANLDDRRSKVFLPHPRSRRPT
jgi:hypothetical protein